MIEARCSRVAAHSHLVEGEVPDSTSNYGNVTLL